MGNSDAFRSMGIWLMNHQAGAFESTGDLAKAGARVLDQLEGCLATLIGRRGARLLLTRAVQAALARHALLGTGQEGLEAEDVVEGLVGRLGGMDPSEVREGVAVVVAEALAILSDFIGEALVTRQVGRVWPNLPQEEIPSDEEGAQ